MLSFLSKIFSVRYDEKTRRIILTLLGLRFKFASKALMNNKFSEFRDAGGDITQAPKADGLFRVIQLANLEILKRVNEICKEHNLDMWLTFGTLLGAVRHKGFIPWDDDIDVEMPRDDYNKIKEIIDSMGENSPLYTELIHSKNDVNIFLKIRHRNIPHTFIDITPIDETKTQLTKKQRLALSNKIKFYRRLMNIKIRNFIKNKDEKGVLEYISKKSEQFFKFSDKQNIENSDLVWGIDFQHKMNDYLVYSHSTYFPLKEIEFEGVNFKCVNDEHTFLTEMYGSYMSWPSKLYAHHSAFKEGQTIEGYFGKKGYEELQKFLGMSAEELEKI